MYDLLPSILFVVASYIWIQFFFKIYILFFKRVCLCVHVGPFAENESLVPSNQVS